MNSIQWGEPRPLRHTADTIPFPLGALPLVLRDMVQAISVTTSTDVGMAGTAIWQFIPAFLLETNAVNFIILKKCYFHYNVKSRQSKDF